MSRVAWLDVSAGVGSVTISLGSGVSLMASTFPTNDIVLLVVTAAIDQVVLLLFNRVAALGGFGARKGYHW